MSMNRKDIKMKWLLIFLSLMLLGAYDNKEKLACKATPDSFDFSNDLNIPIIYLPKIIC